MKENDSERFRKKTRQRTKMCGIPAQSKRVRKSSLLFSPHGAVFPHLGHFFWVFLRPLLWTKAAGRQCAPQMRIWELCFLSCSGQMCQEKSTSCTHVHRHIKDGPQQHVRPIYKPAPVEPLQIKHSDPNDIKEWQQLTTRKAPEMWHSSTKVAAPCLLSQLTSESKFKASCPTAKSLTSEFDLVL